jgi:signal transduction histidine kinase
MNKLQRISSFTALVYLIINILATIYEASEIQHEQNMYLIFRGISLLLAFPCYFLFKKSALNPTPQILLAISLLIYNMAGYYFKPLYIPSFIHSIYALAFFIFMSRSLFIVTSTLMTGVFISFCLWAHPYLHYNPGDLSKFDIISVPTIALVLALMIHHFYTAQRQVAELAHIKFGTLGRLSARALHDVKGSLQTPILLTEQIQAATNSNNFQLIKELTQNLQNQFLALRQYLISYNQISQFADFNQTNFSAVDSLHNALSILEGRLASTQIEIVGDTNILGSKNLFTSIFINLITNSLDEFDKIPSENNKIFIQIKNDSISYNDFIPVTDPNLVEQILNNSFTTKSEGSGLGLYFIKEALEQFNGKLDITLKDNNLFFTILLKKKYLRNI